MNIKKNIKYFAAFFIPFSFTAIYRPQVEVINKHWINGSFAIAEPYLTILLILFLIIIPVGLIYAFQYIQLLKEELKDIKDDLYVEGVLDELAMEMGEYDEDDEY
jgi:hypothetical protein